MSMKRSKSIDLTSGPILKTLSELALPIMASSLLGTAYNITDMAWIGLLGSKAYVRDHKEELEKMVLNINLDMIGTYMGKFISCVSAEDKLAHYISYMAAEIGFPIEAKTGVYSSDSTPFADSGIPALSFARIASSNVAPIHCRYDVKEVMSMEQLQGDIDFLVKFTERFANAAVCPVAREIPEKIKKELDEYLARKRKEQ